MILFCQTIFITAINIHNFVFLNQDLFINLRQHYLLEAENVKLFFFFKVKLLSIPSQFLSVSVPSNDFLKLFGT